MILLAANKRVQLGASRCTSHMRHENGRTVCFDEVAFTRLADQPLQRKIYHVTARAVPRRSRAATTTAARALWLNVAPEERSALSGAT
jgi:hypothetical protein